MMFDDCRFGFIFIDFSVLGHSYIGFKVGENVWISFVTIELLFEIELTTIPQNGIEMCA